MTALNELAARVRQGDELADRELTALAGGGDFQAQRELLTICLGDPMTLRDRTFAEVARLEILARFLALRGGDMDARRLAGVLWQMGRTAPLVEQRQSFAAQAIKLMLELADRGDGIASAHLAEIADDFPDEWRAADAPLPAVKTALTLGDIIANAQAALASPPPLPLLARVREWISERVWSVRIRFGWL